MDQSEVIVTLTTRNLELEAKVKSLTAQLERVGEARDTLIDHVSDMQKALDYEGHPGNMADVIRSRIDG